MTSYALREGRQRDGLLAEVLCQWRAINSCGSEIFSVVDNRVTETSFIHSSSHSFMSSSL